MALSRNILPPMSRLDWYAFSFPLAGTTLVGLFQDRFQQGHRNCAPLGFLAGVRGEPVSHSNSTLNGNGPALYDWRLKIADFAAGRKRTWNPFATVNRQSKMRRGIANRKSSIGNPPLN